MEKAGKFCLPFLFTIKLLKMVISSSENSH